jgi:hypothetical protein
VSKKQHHPRRLQAFLLRDEMPDVLHDYTDEPRVALRVSAGSGRIVAPGVEAPRVWL